MKKERPQTHFKNNVPEDTSCRRTCPPLTLKFQSIFTAFVLLFFLMGNNTLNAQAPTSICDDPIEVSSPDCVTNANTPSGGWGALPVNGLQTLLFGFPGGAFIEIDFNCLEDDMDAVGDLEIRLASSAFLSTCTNRLENVYDVRDSDGNEALGLLTILVTFEGCSGADTEAPVVTCAEFTGSGTSCPESHDPNTPNGVWASVPASGTFTSAVGGGVAQGTVDLNGCVTDNVSALSELEYTLLASYQENVVPGCSKDIINEIQIRDACGNVSPTTIIFRGTITYGGPPPTITTCPADVTLDCGDSIDPMDTGFPVTDLSCGTPTFNYFDGPPSGTCGGTIGGTFTRTWQAFDACGNSGSICLQTITITDVEAPEVTCAEFTETFLGCPDVIFPNTPSGTWIGVPASGTFQTAVGGSYISTIDLNGCVTDACSEMGDMELMVSSSYEENRVAGCSVDIINEYMIRDACGNVSPTTFQFRGTIMLDGSTLSITCPANITIECGESTDPAATGMATATGACNVDPIVTFADVVTTDCGGDTGVINRLWTATDACGNTATCPQTITIEDTTAPEVTCAEFTETFAGCADFIFQNTPSGTWVGVPASGTFQTAVGGSYISTIDLNGCVTDACNSIGDMEIMVSASYEENRIPGCSVDIINEYMLRDACGNVSSTTFLFRGTIMFDGPAPDITCPADLEVECGDSIDPMDTGMATATSDCGTPTLVFADVVTAGDCGMKEIISRTWTATDGCGQTRTCVQVITEVDNTAPEVTCAEFTETFSGCPDFIFPNTPSGTWIGVPTSGTFQTAVGGIYISTIDLNGCVADACSNIGDMEIMVSASYEENRIPGCSVDIINEYMLRDACGNASPTTFLFRGTIMFDGPAPEITCPANLMLECDQPTDPAATGIASATSDCGSPDIIFSDVSTQGVTGCAQYEYMISRIWTATDGCGRTSTCVQIIEVMDSTPPVIACPVNPTIECDQSTDPAATGMAVAIDNCSVADETIITSSDVSTQGMGCSEFSYIIIRTWTATDVCDNSSTCSQIITVEDNNPPVLTVPADVTVECDQPTDPGATGNATASMDNCATDDQLTVTFIDVSTQTPTGCGNDTYMITRTWTASDPCGNTAQDVQIIMVEDTTPPTIVCPANTTIECDEDTSPANTGMAVAVDDCAASPEIVITFADASTQTASGCGQYQYVITRTWTATDPCGNSASCVQLINVEDTTAPEIVCPADVVISCTDSTDPADNGIATGSDNCSAVNEVAITSSDVSTQTNEGCGKFTYEIFRTWLATDACGNTTTCVQNIAVADTEAPVITCPPNQTLTCFETVPAPHLTAADFIAAGGTISDNCTMLLTDFTVLNQNADNGGDNCPGNSRTVVRTYFVQDACGNTSSCEQTFTYLASDQGPVITSVLPSCYKYCASLANPMEEDITYDTDCSFGATVSITGPTQIGQDNCPGSIYRYTYTVTDDCGRTSTPVTRDFIIGNDGPTIECAPFNLILECGDPNNQEYIDTHLDLFEVNTSCELGYTVNYFPQNFNLISCGSATVVTFVATDDCGRTASCTTTIAIQDVTPPVFTAVPPSVCDAIDCSADVNYWYNHWIDYMEDGLEAEDDCDSNVSIQAVNTPVNTDCPNGDAITVVTFVATDNCGNEAEITGTFTVTATPDNSTIMGMVATEQGETVENVTVTLEGPNNYTNSDVSAEDGIYGFENLLLGGNYHVTPFLDEDHLNGISSFDLVLMSKHILEIQQLDSPYKMIAADVNNSGSISTLDIVALRKVILHIDEAFDNNTSWRFVEAAYVFPEPNNPFASTFPEEVFINGLAAGEQHDFVGVKIGDVNGSVVANAQADAEDRTFDGQLDFGLKNRELKAGETYDVEFLAADFVEMMGYQFTLNFDATQIEFEGLEAGSLPNMTESNFGLNKLAEGVITTSWTNQKGVTLMDDATLFTLRFTAKTNSTLSDVVSIGSRYTAAEAYRKVDTNSGIALEELALRFDTDKFGGAKFELHQNAPNPFADETLIGFNLPSNSSATITVYDMSGRMLKQVEGEYTKGYHTLAITKDELKGSTGILYYELATPTQRTTKKMTLIRR